MGHLTDQAIGQFIGQHYILIGAALWLVSTVISTMPSPTEQGGAAYRWAFNLLHTLMGNAGRIAGTRTALGVIVGLVMPRQNNATDDNKTPQG